MKHLKTNARGSGASFTDGDGDTFDIDVWTDGSTFIGVTPKKGPRRSALLSNAAAHELRDFLNRRFPS